MYVHSKILRLSPHYGENKIISGAIVMILTMLIPRLSTAKRLNLSYTIGSGYEIRL